MAGTARMVGANEVARAIERTEGGVLGVGKNYSYC